MGQDEKLRSLAALNKHEQAKRGWWRSLVHAFKQEQKWSVGRNEAAYDITVDRRKRDAVREGIKNAFILMPMPRGQRQTEKRS